MVVKDEEIKQECIERLKILKLDEKIIQDFIVEDKLYATNMTNDDTIEVTLYANVKMLVKSFEDNQQVKIYHIINNEKVSNNMVYLLYVDKNKSEWSKEKSDLKRGFAQIYCYRETRDIKHIGIQTNAGKIVKIYN